MLAVQMHGGAGMARRSRKNQRSVVGTLFVEFSALAGILGIAQPSVRDTFWRAIQPPAASAPSANVPAANMRADTSSTAAGLSSNVYQSTPESSSIYFQPFASVPMQVDPRCMQNMYQPTRPKRLSFLRRVSKSDGVLADLGRWARFSEPRIIGRKLLSHDGFLARATLVIIVPL